MMGRLVALLVVASSIGGSMAACNKNCFGKGTCGAFDRCSCFNAWNYAQAQDCSQRVCQYGTAWGVTASGAARPYKECSEQGVCNRGTGECECFDGFTGSSCQRTTCPSGCSGHGQCQTIKTWGYSTAWDSEMTMACKCDAGFEGPACNMRMCPRGDDPLSTGQNDEIHQIVIAGGATLAGTFVLQLTAWDGQVYTTRALDIATVTTTSLSEAIQSLSNSAFPVVITTVVPSLNTLTLTIAFTSSENSGGQSEVVALLGSANTVTAGNQPMYFISSLTPTSVTTISTPSTEEGLVCSARGSCDPDSGRCTCNQGFHGHSCNQQTALQ